jgi:hypothetical protein
MSTLLPTQVVKRSLGDAFDAEGAEPKHHKGAEPEHPEDAELLLARLISKPEKLPDLMNLGKEDLSRLRKIIEHPYGVSIGDRVSIDGVLIGGPCLIYEMEDFVGNVEDDIRYPFHCNKDGLLNDTYEWLKEMDIELDIQSLIDRIQWRAEVKEQENNEKEEEGEDDEEDYDVDGNALWSFIDRRSNPVDDNQENMYWFENNEGNIVEGR